jgi:hypothetical protein
MKIEIKIKDTPVCSECGGILTPGTGEEVISDSFYAWKRKDCMFCSNCGCFFLKKEMLKERENTWTVNEFSKPDKKRVIGQIKEYLEDFIK